VFKSWFDVASFDHRRPGRVGVLLANLGTPEAATAGALRPYLRQFLADPRVIELPRWKWLPILHLFVLPRRPAQSAELYRKVWTDEGSPLLAIARRLQLVAAAEQLTRLAASVASRRAESGALPASIAGWPDAALPDAASGSLPRYELRADGTATLELPAARELVERERSAAGLRHPAAERRSRLLRWHLAADRTNVEVGGSTPSTFQEVPP